MQCVFSFSNFKQKGMSCIWGKRYEYLRGMSPFVVMR